MVIIDLFKLAKTYPTVLEPKEKYELIERLIVIDIKELAENKEEFYYVLRRIQDAQIDDYGRVLDSKISLVESFVLWLDILIESELFNRFVLEGVQSVFYHVKG